MILRRYCVGYINSAVQHFCFTRRGALKLCRKHFAHAFLWHWEGKRWRSMPWQAMR